MLFKWSVVFINTHDTILQKTRGAKHMPIAKIAAGVGVAVVGLVVTMLMSGVLTSNQQTHSSEISISGANIGVYTDSACNINCTSVSAGAVSPGTSKTYTVFVKNTGTVPMTLSMATAEWNPTSANGPITLTWDREDYSLTAGASVSATLMLTVSSSIGQSINAFSFDIAITGTE